MKCIFLGAAVFLSFLGLNGHAADIAGDVQSGLNLNQDGGYFELGISAGYIDNPYRTRLEQEFEDLHLDIDGSGVFRKNGFFLEGVQGTQDGLNIGYNLFQNSKWSVDLLAASMNHSYEIDQDNKVRQGDDENTRNRKLYDRNTFYLGTGFRLTRYIDKYVIQYRLVTDTLDNHGVVSTLRAGRGWQVRNWNIFAIASANYTSEKTNNYWFQVEPHEATSRYPVYNADSSISYSLQFGVVKPLSEKWVLRLYGGWVQFPEEARNSPLVDDSDFTYAAIAVNRVFSWGF